MANGFIKKMSEKSGKGKRGAWTIYSMIVENEDGSESGWISLGFDKPSLKEGDYGKYEVTKTDRGQDLASWEKLSPPPKAEATIAKSNEIPVQRSSSYVDRNDSIVYQSSRKDALALVGLLLDHDALPMSASTAKAGQAKRFEEVKAFVDKLTVEYFADVQSLRILSKVVDAGLAAPAAATSGSADTVADND